MNNAAQLKLFEPVTIQLAISFYSGYLLQNMAKIVISLDGNTREIIEATIARK